MINKYLSLLINYSVFTAEIIKTVMSKGEFWLADSHH
jgi:hypothetical protein